jgi:DNA-binding IclR family transcriptional regulator
MPYEQTYTVDDFLNAMPIGIPITQNGIVKRVGCSVPTAKKYLAQLEEQGKVRQVPVIGSYNINWERVV